MKSLLVTLIALFLQACFSFNALAESRQSALVPLPSIEDFTRGEDGWAFGLGLGVEYEAAYEGSDEYQFELDPAGAVQWRKGDNIFYWAGESIGWRGLRSDVWLIDVALDFDEGRAENDSDEGYLDGLGESDESNQLLLQTRRAFNEDWRIWLDSRLVVGNNGALALLGLGSRFGQQNDGSGHEVAAAVLFHDSDFANHEFGVNGEQSVASGLDETKLSAGFRSLGFNYNYRHFVNEHWQVFGEILYEYYGNEVADSPIARNRYEAEVGIGFVYVF